MKKILVLHNKYQNYGGEDSNLENEILFLRKHYKVDNLIVKNSNKINFNSLISFLFLSNSKSNKQLINKINEFNPDLVYVHNTWFTLNLGIFKILKKERIKTVIKIHNFRYKCAYSFFKKKHLNNNKFCMSCNFSTNETLFFNKYFQDSYIKSLLVIYYSKMYQRILKSNYFFIFTISQFHMKYLLEAGVNKKKVELFYNPIEIPPKNNYNPKSNYIIFAGRLTKEKGIEELLSSWLNSNLNKYTLKIVGSGHMKPYLIKKYNSPNIEFLGEMDNFQVLELIKNAKAVVTATKMYEGHSRLLSEASSLGVPSIFPKFGSMVEFFPDKYELSFEQYNYESLTEQFLKLEDENLLSNLSITNFKFLKNKLNSDILISKFEKILSDEK